MVGEEIHPLTITEARSQRLRLPLTLSAQSTSTKPRCELAHFVEVHRLGVQLGGLGSQTPPPNASSVVAARCAAGRRAATQGIGMAAVTSDQSLSNEGRALSSRRRRRPRRIPRPTAPPVRVGAPRPPVISLAWAAVVTSARRVPVTRS